MSDAVAKSSFPDFFSLRKFHRGRRLSSAALRKRSIRNADCRPVEPFAESPVCHVPSLFNFIRKRFEIAVLETLMKACTSQACLIDSGTCILRPCVPEETKFGLYTSIRSSKDSNTHTIRDRISTADSNVSCE